MIIINFNLSNIEDLCQFIPNYHKQESIKINFSKSNRNVPTKKELVADIILLHGSNENIKQKKKMIKENMRKL